MEKIVKINLGSGNDYREGYINVDNGLMFPNAKVDFIGDIKTFSTLKNSVDEILLSHVIMYFRPEELQPLLKTWHGWLKKGGKLIIETSDIRKLAKIVGISTSPQSIINDFGLINIFGTPKTGPHRWGWSVKALKSELLKAEFSKLEINRGLKKPDRDFRIIAKK